MINETRIRQLNLESNRGARRASLGQGRHSTVEFLVLYALSYAVGVKVKSFIQHWESRSAYRHQPAVFPSQSPFLDLHFDCNCERGFKNTSARSPTDCNLAAMAGTPPRIKTSSL